MCIITMFLVGGSKYPDVARCPAGRGMETNSIGPIHAMPSALTQADIEALRKCINDFKRRIYRAQNGDAYWAHGCVDRKGPRSLRTIGTEDR